MNIKFTHLDLHAGNWVEVKDRNRRKNRVKEVDEVEDKARKFVRKPKKVKPGYKKKMKLQTEQIKKRERRLNKQNKRS